MKLSFRLFIFVSFFIWSCSSTDPKPKDQQDSKLVESEFVGEYSKSQILNIGQSTLGSAAVGLGLFLQYDVKLYKITYKTKNTEGKEVIASGAFIIPSSTSSFPLVSYHHATMFDEKDAPSYFGNGAESLIGLIFASAGYLTSAPDYLGYGASKSEQHPYEHATGLAVPNADMLFAVKDFIKKEKINWNLNLLLCGYSEGGYATLATQKLLEEKYAGDFKIKASSSGSGAYYKSLMIDELITKPSSGEVTQNRSFIWVLQAYNRIYKLNRPMSYYFKEPYASKIESEGHHVDIAGSFNQLLNPDFVKNYTEGKETGLINVFKENDLINWKTNVYTLLTHGSADNFVPYINSTAALEGMKKAGSTQVFLKTINNGTHESSVQDFILETYTLFANNRT